MTGRLEGKVAMITGAATGMGAEHARPFIEEGAKVVLTDVNTAAGEQLAAELGGNALFSWHDVADPESWTAAVDAATEAFGPVSVLVNNAGLVGPEASVADMSTEDDLRTIAIDQYGSFFGMRAVIAGMIAAGGGSIVNISSVAGFVHKRNVPNPAYTTAKFAVRGLAKAAAVHYGDRNIRVNSLHPGGVLTPMLASSLPQPVLDSLAATIPLRRLARPREVSYLVLFLASDEASYITGAEHLIDGRPLAAAGAARAGQPSTL